MEVLTAQSSVNPGQTQFVAADASGRLLLAPGSADDSAMAAVRTISTGTEYETVAASQTAQVIGATGATGDFMERLICVVATAATSAVTLLDNAISISMLPNAVGGGIGTYVIPIGLKSVSGAWKITTAAGVSVIAVGNFT
jgi:hypothetical protein